MVSLVHRHSPLSIDARICSITSQSANPSHTVHGHITTHLSTSSMPQILPPSPIHLPPQMIPRMHHLMRKCILQMPPIPHLICTDQNPMLRTKPPALPHHPSILRHPRRTPPAHHIALIQRPVQRSNLVPQEADGGRVLEEEGAVFFAARAVARFVDAVAVFAVVFDAFGGDTAGQDVEVGDPPF